MVVEPRLRVRAIAVIVDGLEPPSVRHAVTPAPPGQLADRVIVPSLAGETLSDGGGSAAGGPGGPGVPKAVAPLR